MVLRVGLNKSDRVACLSAIALACCGASQAQTAPPPVLPVLAGGSNAVVGATVGTPTNNGYDLMINQTAAKAILNWDSFNIGVGSKVRFSQLDASSIALNRVTGAQQSLLEGQLSANGQVWLLNPNGVLIGSGGEVNTRGFLATTRSLSDTDFNASSASYGFKDVLKPGRVVNQGRIVSLDGGYAVLAAEQVSNEGAVQANLGAVVLGGATAFTVNFSGDRLLSFVVDTPEANTQRNNTNSLPIALNNAATGTLMANGGKVLLTAKAVGDVVSGVINTSGLINANSVSIGNAGEVVFGQVIVQGDPLGLVTVGGTVNASGKSGGLPENAAIAVSGGDIVVDGLLQKTGGVMSSIQLAANGRVDVVPGAMLGAANVNNVSAAPTAISIVSNAANGTNGGIRIAAGASLRSFGGDIVLAGGRSPVVPTDPNNIDSALLSLGFAANPNGHGVEIGNSFFSTTLLGPTTTNTSASTTTPTGALIDAGGGNITIRGQAGRLIADTGAGSQGATGVLLGNGSGIFTTGTGAVNITGYAQDALPGLTQNGFLNAFSYKGISLGQGSLIETDAGAITLLGKGGGDISLNASGTTVTLSGITASNNQGIELNGAVVTSNTGKVALYGQGGGNLSLANVGVYSQPAAQSTSADGFGSGFLGSFVNHGVAVFSSIVKSVTGAVDVLGISGGRVQASGIELGNSSICADPTNFACNTSAVVASNSGVFAGFESLLSAGELTVKGRSLATLELTNATLGGSGVGGSGPVILNLSDNTGIASQGGRFVASAPLGNIVLKGSSEGTISVTGSATRLEKDNQGVRLGLSYSDLSPTSVGTGEVQTQTFVTTESGISTAVQAQGGRVEVFAAASDTSSVDLAILDGATVAVTEGAVSLRADSLALTGSVSGGQNATLLVSPLSVGTPMELGDGGLDVGASALRLSRSVLEKISGFGRTVFGGDLDVASQTLQLIAGTVTIANVGDAADTTPTASVTDPQIDQTGENFIGVLGQRVEVQQSLNIAAQDRILLFGKDSVRLLPNVSVSVAGQLDLVGGQFVNGAGGSALLRSPQSSGVWRIWTPSRAAAGVDAQTMSANGLAGEQEVFDRPFSLMALAAARANVVKNSFIYAGAASGSTPQDIVDQLPEDQQANLEATLTQVQQLVRSVGFFQPDASALLPPPPLTPPPVSPPLLSSSIQANEPAASGTNETAVALTTTLPLERPATVVREPLPVTAPAPLAQGLAAPERPSPVQGLAAQAAAQPVQSPLVRASTAVTAPPASPVGEVKPTTPKDVADSKDSVLANASPMAVPKPAQQSRRAAVRTAATQVGTTGLQLLSTPRASAAATMEQRFSLMGNRSAW